MSAADFQGIRRRYHLLLALRFVPTGLFITVFVLLLRDRGLSLAEIGLGTAAQGIVMLFLELPSGGLADALGRKPVLVLAGLVSMLATAVVLVADTVLLLAVAFALQGVFRALDSGPLQAWFIDASFAADPNAAIDRDLARADVVICASIGAGALLGGLIVHADGLVGLAPLAAPIVLGLVVQGVGVVAVITLMDEVRSGQGWAAARQSVAEVPTVVREAVHLIRGSSLLTALVIGELLWGFGMLAFEMLLPPRLAEVSGGVDEAASLLGPAITAAWVLSAVGAAVAPMLVRRLGSGWAGFSLRLAHGATVVAHGPRRRAHRTDRRLPGHLLGARRHGTDPLRHGAPGRREQPPGDGRVGQLAHLAGRSRHERHRTGCPRRRHQHRHRDVRGCRRAGRRRAAVPGGTHPRHSHLRRRRAAQPLIARRSTRRRWHRAPSKRSSGRAAPAWWVATDDEMCGGDRLSRR